jgi:hypothetical protein
MLEPAEVDGELSRERPWGELRERQALLEILLGDPAALLDEIPLHVADQRDGSAEAQASEPQEVDEQLSQAVSRLRMSRGGVRLRYEAHSLHPRCVLTPRAYARQPCVSTWS